MLYMTGEDDTLAEVQSREENDIPDFLKRVSEQNPHLRLSNPTLTQKLPSYTPIYMVSDPTLQRIPSEDVMGDLLRFPLENRKVMHELQEQNVDMLSLLATWSLFESLQGSAADFRKGWGSPLIETPWEPWNKSVKNSSLLSLFGRTAGYSSELISNSRYMRSLDRLSVLMYQRDLLNTELHLLAKNRGNRADIQILDTRIKEMTAEIKQLLPKSLETRLSQMVNRLYQGSFARYRSNAGSKKIGRLGRAYTTHLDFLSKSGLVFWRKVTDGLVKTKGFLKKSGYVMGLGVVGYDTYAAYKNNESMGRALTTGITGFGAGVAAGAVASYGTSLGVVAVGSIMAQAGVSSLALVCIPVVGWVVIIGAGVVASGFVASYASEMAGRFYDNYVVDFYEKHGEKMIISVKEIASDFINQMKEQWDRRTDFLSEFYGIKEERAKN